MNSICKTTDLMKTWFYYGVLLLILLGCKTQMTSEKVSTATENTSPLKKENQPRLVVGIVVDQMRYDYLTRFKDKYSEGGFKRLMSGGFNCKNNHFNYIPTYTGPGHASVFTGTTPKYHGIISNSWYDKTSNETVYCVEDTTVAPIGTSHKYSRVSPSRMVATTITDELKVATQKRGKVIGIALKDRGAVLPAGHAADAAYWFHGEDQGHWVSSSYYMNQLPSWVKAFNADNRAEAYFKTWDTYYDIETYTESGSDLNNYENGFKGKRTATFPYDLVDLKEANNNFDILKTTPFGNSLTTDFAIEAVKGEALGKDEVTDFLTLSYSSTDYIGHNFGVNSKEIEDTYIRLDKDLERFLQYLDNEVGSGNYTVFLTADHGAVHVPQYLQDHHHITAGYAENREFVEQLMAFVEATYGTADIIKNISNYQIFLNEDKLQELNLNLNVVQESIVNEIISYKDVYKAYSAFAMRNSYFNDGLEALLQLGYNQKRSGDVLFVLSPSTITYSKKGSTHGSGFNYDTHVPLIFYGAGIKQGSTFKATEITDVAPTISALLNIAFPNAAIGSPLQFVLD